MISFWDWRLCVVESAARWMIRDLRGVLRSVREYGESSVEGLLTREMRDWV